jgi:type IV pilus assembly protein PilM
MLKDFQSFLGAQSYLGVDIGTNSIKIVEIAGTSSPRLINYGILESYSHLARPNGAIQSSSLKIMSKDTAEMIKMLLNKTRFHSREVAVSVPAFSVFISLLELPEMPEADLVKNLRFQIPQYVPLPLAEISIDWIKVGKREDENGFIKQQVLIVAIPNEQIERYKEIFRLVGLNLRILEFESLSLVRSLTTNQSLTALIVDIGCQSTNIMVAKDGYLKYNTQTNFAGNVLTQAIGRGLGINLYRAEELKKQKGILSEGGEYELSTLIIPFLDVIINEIERTKDTYEKNSDSKIEKIILTGGSSKIIGLEKYLAERMGLPVELGNPFIKINYPNFLETLIKDLSPSLAVAIGLGLRKFV